MGFSYSYIPGSSGRQVPALYACDDCPFPTQNLPQFEIVEYRDPYFGPFKHNGFSNVVNSSQLALGAGGLLYGVGEHVVVNGNNWLGLNGKYYNNSWGGNGVTSSRVGAYGVSSAYKIAGRSAFILGAALSAGEGIASYREGNYLGVGKSGVDIGMGAAATYGGPVGLVAGGLYFGVDAIMSVYTNRLYSNPGFLRSEFSKATTGFDIRYGGSK